MFDLNQFGGDDDDGDHNNLQREEGGVLEIAVEKMNTEVSAVRGEKILVTNTFDHKDRSETIGMTRHGVRGSSKMFQ